MLKNIIDEQLQKKALRTGAMGTESVSIDIELTDEQLQEFYKINFSDNYHWEVTDNIVTITYVEQIITRESHYNDYCVIEYSNNVVEFSDNQETVQIKQYIDAHDIIYDEDEGYINIEIIY
jgi:hypothetical protein